MLLKNCYLILKWFNDSWVNTYKKFPFYCEFPVKKINVSINFSLDIKKTNNAFYSLFFVFLIRLTEKYNHLKVFRKNFFYNVQKFRLYVDLNNRLEILSFLEFLLFFFFNNFLKKKNNKNLQLFRQFVVRYVFIQNSLVFFIWDFKNFEEYDINLKIFSGYLQKRFNNFFFLKVKIDISKNYFPILKNLLESYSIEAVKPLF